MKSSSLPAQVLKKINEILYKNDDLLLFYQSMVENDKNSADNSKKSMWTFFSNDAQWANRILNQQSIVALQTAQQSRRDLEGVYSKWASYVNRVDNRDQWIPTPNQSDACLKTLASNTNVRLKTDSLPKCKVSNICYKLLVEGSNFGYALTHRTLSWIPQDTYVSRRMFAAYYSMKLLRNFLPIRTRIAPAQSLLLPILDYADACYLDLTVEPLNKLERLQNLCIRFIFSLRKVLVILLARMSRSCTLLSPVLDRELAKRLCTTAYNEAEYIAMNDFKLVDLMMEQMTLCSLDGHTQFLRRSWLKQILRFQYPRGCFGTVIYKPKTANGVIKTTAQRKLSREADIDKECEGHVTAVAAATLASMVRFVLVIFY